MSEEPLAEFYIKTEGGQTVFFVDGSTIRGTVELKVDEPKEGVKGIYVSLVGNVHTEWTVRKHYNGKTHTSHPGGKRDFLTMDTLLWQPSEGGDHILPAGQYSWPFSFTLKTDEPLPATCYMQKGQVLYVLRGRIEKDSGIIYRCFLPITVLPVIDCNKKDYSKVACSHDEWFNCCLCCKSGPTVIDVSVPSVAWCPGETIPIHIKLFSREKGVFTKITYSLNATLTVTTNGGSSSSYELQNLAGDNFTCDVKKGDSIDTIKYLRVPPSCPSFSREAGVLASRNVRIDVHFENSAGELHNYDSSVPIVIGTIPHAKPPGDSSDQTVEYSWANAEQITKMALSGQEATPIEAEPFHNKYHDNFDPEYFSLPQKIKYVFFDLPGVKGSSTEESGDAATTTTTTTTTTTPSGADVPMPKTFLVDPASYTP